MVDPSEPSMEAPCPQMVIVSGRQCVSVSLRKYMDWEGEEEVDSQ